MFRYGHWECGTVDGKRRKACLVTLVDRKGQYLLKGKVEKKVQFVNSVMLRELKD